MKKAYRKRESNNKCKKVKKKYSILKIFSLILFMPMKDICVLLTNDTKILQYRADLSNDEYKKYLKNRKKKGAVKL
jgi:hypothetical protein